MIRWFRENWGWFAMAGIFLSPVLLVLMFGPSAEEKQAQLDAEQAVKEAAFVELMKKPCTDVVIPVGWGDKWECPRTDQRASLSSNDDQSYVVCRCKGDE